MQFLSTTALLGLLSAIGAADASRCKTRPGQNDHTAVPTTSSTASVEATQEATPTTAVQSTLPVAASSTLVTSDLEVSSSSSSAAASPTTVEATVSSAVSSSEATSAASSTASASVAASAVPVVNAPAQAELCADDQQQLLTEWGLVVSNFRVQESDVEGTVCTTYNGVVTLPDGQAAVKFTADANLVYEEATINDNKYYSNVGLGKNVPSQLSSIASIPASYSWSRTNTTNFRGKSAPPRAAKRRPASSLSPGF